jgi:signal transduction histidine kinase/CheY-like chemotaxis protein
MDRNFSLNTEEKTSTELLISTSRHVVYSTGSFYLLFHFVASLFFPRIFSPRLWLCTIILVVTFLLTLWFMERVYYLAQIIWLLGITATIVTGFLIFQRPEILFLLTILPIMAIVTLGVIGTLIIEAMMLILTIFIPGLKFLPQLPGGYQEALIFSFIFSGVFGWGISSNIISAIDEASYHYYEARKRLQETRQHRAEISRMLKEQGQSNYQLKQMNRMLEQARAKAEEAREDRDRFAMAVSHELRSPLNFIIGFSDLMVNVPETYEDPINWPPGLYDDVHEIYNSSKHLMDLINDILDMGKMDAKRMPLFRERVEPAAIINEIKELVSSQIAQKNLQLILEYEPDLPYIFVDRTRIRQVLLNIVANSLRFTEDGYIKISSKLVDIDDVEISVTDTGPGITAEDLEKIFDEFRQVGQENWSREKGSGLGLSISKRFVELHGGKMKVESKVGSGTIIRITLPLMEPLPSFVDLREDLSEGGQQRVVSMQARKQSDVILCYTLDRIRAKMVGQSIAEQEIIVADNLPQLKEMVQIYFPSAILMDEAVSNHPEISTFLKQLPADLPVITFLFAGIPNRSLSLPFGVYRYLVKPVSRDLLIQTIQSLGGDVKNLLVVDDDPTMVRLFTQAIKSSSQINDILKVINFIPAYTGNEALTILRSQQVDAVLLDLDLPDIHGTQVINEIKKDEKIKNTPVIIISASDMSEDIRHHQASKFQILINRPYERDELALIIRTVSSHFHPTYDEQFTVKLIENPDS